MRQRAGRVRLATAPSVTLVIGILAAVVLAACGRQGGPASAPGAFAKLLVRGGGPDPDSLDPQKARGFEAQSIVRDVCEGLTTLDRQAGVAPGIAKGWSVSPDGRTWTFTLRPNARWSNGSSTPRPPPATRSTPT
jgi:oligopeptide transport system substrate-binding protein